MFGVFRKVNKGKDKSPRLCLKQTTRFLCELEQFAAVLWGGGMSVPHKENAGAPQDAVGEPEALTLWSCTAQVWSETSQRTGMGHVHSCFPFSYKYC